MPEGIIQTRELTKVYGEVTAVDRLNLEVREGEIFGFLGPNGSGKTTTILMLMGLTVPTSGTGTVGGYDIIKESREVRRITGCLPEAAGYYEDKTAEQNLDYFGQLSDIPKAKREKRINELLEFVGLKKWKDVKVEKFSRGMKQRLGIAQALIREPRIVFLDEPTIGLDPQGTKEVRDLILRLNNEQKLTVFLSSHLLYEVQQICSRVGIIRQGRLVATDTIENLSRELAKKKGYSVEFELDKSPRKLLDEIKSIRGVTSIDEKNGKLVVHMNRDVRAEVSRTITKHGSTILLMNPKEYTLEEIFLGYYKEAK